MKTILSFAALATFASLVTVGCGKNEQPAPPSLPVAAPPATGPEVMLSASAPTPAPLPPAPSAPPPLPADARASVDWSLGNSTGPDRLNCPQDYFEIPICTVQGGRACYARKAVERAKSGNCAGAIKLMLVTQCHNGGAQTVIGANAEAVCNYMRTK